MRLLYLRVDRALSCGGLLDHVELSVPSERKDSPLAPLCLIGPNGTGKSQLLQLIAEIFQASWNQCAPDEERESSNKESLFEIRYRCAGPSGESRTVRLAREANGRRIGQIEMCVMDDDGQWQNVLSSDRWFREHLPSVVVGYTSGDNETLSLPFFVSRSGYAADVREAAMPTKGSQTRGARSVPNNRLLLIDYSTHLEVLVSNLLLAGPASRRAIIAHANLDDLASFRCIIQLNHRAAPRAPAGAPLHRKGIQLTAELEAYIDSLKRASTCWNYDEKQEVYTFDFFVDDQIRAAFTSHFSDAVTLYRALHKFSLLNDLAIPRAARERLRREIETRRFASRLPEPQDEDKVFRFEQVSFRREVGDGFVPLDYVSLSDGEHQFAQILGMFSMIEDEGALFVLDEPESHFNPQWRVQFTKMLLGLPSPNRGQQDVLLTTHAPFVPCDLPRDQVLIFSKNEDGELAIQPPSIETFGASFDRILDACFSVRPPISQVARDEIGDLLQNGSVEQITAALTKLGPSVERSFLADRVRQLKSSQT
jgi:restriction system-associated AAA family ATPase